MKEIHLERGEELLVRSEGRSFIVRGTLRSLQIYSQRRFAPSAPHLYAGTTRGIVKGSTFSVGFVRDIPEDGPTIPALEI